MKINYQLVCDKEIESLNGRVPKLLLQSCCGPCSSYVMEYLSRYFSITVLYYNPNIYPEEEYNKRLFYQKKVIEELEAVNPITIMETHYDEGEFLSVVKGLEHAREGGERCPKCFRLRLEETAKQAKANNFEYFTTTLSVSPHKNAEVINNIGAELEEKYGVKYLIADFKKREGYKRSIELSKKYDLYRQDYCGCRFSLRAGEE